MIGEMIEYNRDGVVISGKTGEVLSYHENGKLRTIENYKNGKRHGEFIRYDKNGQTISQSTYKDGTFVRQFGNGFVSIIEGIESQKIPRLFINSIGEGGIKVCNEGGNIENGDLLCSSSKTGLAMKQEDDLVRNYTIGKATMDYNFNSDTETKLIGCVYYCG